jgi:hypothetical protein
MIPDPVLRLFSTCIPFSPDTDAIRRAAGEITDWAEVVARAEHDGFTPLLLRQLSSAGVALPQESSLQLKILSARHRLANQARAELLEEVTALFNQNGIPSLALKGGALMHLLYPDPALRPMSDLDLLIARSDLEQAGALIQGIGGQRMGELKAAGKGKHLPGFSLKRGVYTHSLEIHYSLFEDDAGWSRFFIEDISHAPQTFALSAGCRVQALGHEDMLFHLCWHAFYEGRGFRPLRLLAVCDIVNYASQNAAKIDWDFVHRRYPSVLHALSGLNAFVPLPDGLLSAASIALKTDFKDTGVDYGGWPVFPLYDWKKVGVRASLDKTLFPPSWWLYLHYGVHWPDAIWYDWFRHLGALLSEAWSRELPAISR